MNDDSSVELESMLAQIESQATSGLDAKDRRLFGDFLRHYYELASMETLKLRSPAELGAIALAHWHLAKTRKADEILVEVEAPREAKTTGTGSFAHVRTVVEDMPFLYDSIGMAVRDTGASIDWTVHPVLRLQRDAAGSVQAARGAAGGGAEARAESLVHIELEALPKAADYPALRERILALVGELRTVVGDYPTVREKVKATAALLDTVPTGADAHDFREAQEFLRWLDEGHFTFLGYSEGRTNGTAGGFRSDPKASLGLLRPGARFADTAELIAPPEELAKYATSSRLVVVTKANVRSPIHHPDYMDFVSVKHFAADGSVLGVSRFLGLFSSEVYTSRPRQIPLIRRKTDYVLKRSRLPESSHSGKNLREILHSLPRDELFQSSEDELFQVCMGIRALRDRHQLRLFMRRDRYGRFYSCMVYLPRDRYSRELRDRVAAELREVCSGESVERNVEFLREGLARIQYIVRTPPGTQIALTVQEVEQRLLAATRSWRDQLREALHQDDPAVFARFADAFLLSYHETTGAPEAAVDVRHLMRLSEQEPVLPRLALDAAGGRPPLLKLYSWKKPIALSDVLPTLENFGLRVVRQDPTEVRPKDSEPLWIQEFAIALRGTGELPGESKARFEAAFLSTWRGTTENDGLNRLVLGAGLDAREVVCLRTMLKYLIQTGLPYSQAYMEQLLAEHPRIALLLVKLFEARFDPQADEKKRKTEELKISQELDALLDKVATLDGDRVLRAFLAVVRAALRTNYYQTATPVGASPARDPSASATDRSRPGVAPTRTYKHYVSIKLDPKKVHELPQPLPMFEVFVYAPEVEGIHLRGGRVARGGLRWSDRKQDFRTEVLGLMKAQNVKNAIIVPVGAKGGFVVKRGDPANREEWLKTGIECYKTFVRALLDITDNRVGDGVTPPPNVVRYDDDDPYLVVAADKGTATFSDIANALSAEYSFWLGDAFASGGSAGYDHKKMGITAKGAWEAVQRHFREAGKDIQNEEFSVVGIGDMSGDVFGNGMLLSRKIKLIAAFDHRHIFLDPHPDLETSFKERQRMFALPRSSWDDYDKALISKGGGVFPRSAKLIKLSPEMQKALDVKRANFTPNELLNAVLKAPVDLLWNGGIGTYVKSQHQSHPECGDRANDAIRVNGRDLRCKVVGEGGNLGCTQPGRVEAALHGVRLNTDFIDNAGGVHSSDREVNIKIPLNRLLQEGKLKRETRDPFLAKLTHDVSAAVLRDNYVQSLAVSLLERDAAARLDEHTNLVRTLERDGLLNRAVEFLPDDEVLVERRARGKGLTRPELAVLTSYSKISLFDALLNSNAPDDPFFDRDLLAYFPPLLAEKYKEPLLKHRLRREIVATILSNATVNRMGFSFAHLFAENHGVPRAEVVKAYAIAHEIYDGDRYWVPIEALDLKVPAALQLRLFGRAIGLMKHATTWLLTYKWTQRPIAEAVSTFHKGIADLTKLLPEILPPTYRADWDKAVAGMEKDGAPHDLAVHLANTMVIGSAPDIIELAQSSKVPLKEAAGAYFQIGDRLRVLWLLSSIIGLQVQGKWQALARHNLREDTYRLHRRIAARILERPGKTAEERIQQWAAADESAVRFGIQRLQELQAAGVQDFMTLAVGVRELRKLRML